ASRAIAAPKRFVVAGRELVAWRGRAGLKVAPSECPHIGADPCDGRVDRERRVVCPWHGLALGARPHGRWAPLPSHDDGVLSWVRLPELAAPGEPLTDAPVIAPRPRRYLDGVIGAEARCEPRDVLANR